MTKPKKHGLDIFKTFGAIDARDMTYYDKLTPEEKKGFFPPVVMRWIADGRAPMTEYFLRAVNERVNPYLYEMSDHPELQYRLMASCGLGMSGGHQWIANKKKDESDIVFAFFEKLYPNNNNVEIRIMIAQFEESKDFEEFVNGTGTEQETVKKLVRAFASR